MRRDDDERAQALRAAGGSAAGASVDGARAADAGVAPPEVLVRFVEDLLRAAERVGVDPAPLAAEAPGLASSERNARIPWVEFVDLMARLEEAVGGPDGLVTLGAGIGGARIVPALRRLAGLSASLVLLYRAAERFALPRAMPCLRSSFSELPAPSADRGRLLQLTCEVPEDLAPCPQLFHMGIGSLRALPRVFGLPEAAVEAQIGERRAEFRVLPPSSRLSLRRLRAGVRSLVSGRAALEQLAAQQGELRHRLRELESAHARLAESEARFRAFSESAIDLVCELSGRGEVLYASPSVRERVGAPREEVVGTSLAAWIHPDDVGAARAALERAHGGRDEGRRSIFRVRHREGGWTWLETEGSRYRARSGDWRVVVILRDVSARVALEEQQRRYQTDLEREVQRRTRQLERRNRELRELQSLLLEAERIETAQDLAGRVAHSVANPLAVLIGQLRLALDEGGLPRARIECLLEQAQRVSDVMERTLELYRERKIDRAPVEVAGVLEEVRAHVEPRARERGVRVELVCDAAARRTLQADRPLLVAALTSLAENGVDATREDGCVRIASELDPARRRLVFRVCDEGGGVPAALRERVFEPFFTTKGSRGTGLGLPIALGVAQGHGREIRIDEGPEGGAVFVASLPLDPPVR